MPDDDIPFDNLKEARDALARAEADRAREVRALDLQARARAAAKALGQHDDDVEARYRAAVGSVAKARTELRNTRSRLKATLVARLADDPADDIAQLDSTVPMAMFPVRLETRFVRSEDTPAELRVRIYPDQITSDSHEPLLSERELTSARRAWERAWNDDDALPAWRTLLLDHDARRASWAIEQTRPLNVEAFGDPDQPPEFPEVETRPDRWSRHPTARLLPDRWCVTTWRDGDLRQRIFGRPVEEALVLSLKISTDGDDESLHDSFPLSDDGLEIDEELKWAFDFDRAVQAGMAVRIPIEAIDLERGFDRVLVTGVRATATPEDAAAEVESLWRIHRHTHGMAFLRQGTPTNNTEDARAEPTPPGDHAAQTFALEWAPRTLAEDGDGRRFAAALGISDESVRRLDRANADEQAPARAMNRLLWPATIGYFVDQLLAPLVERQRGDAIRAFFEQHVRGRGPLAALRIGSVPYAVLPTAAIRAWKPTRETPTVERWIGDLIARLLPTWTEAARGAPQAFASSDADADLLGVLGQSASSREVSIRKAMGWESRWNLLAMLGFDPAPWEAARRSILRGLLSELGLEFGPDGQDPRIFSMDYADDAHRFWGPMVERDPLSETEALDPNYLQWLSVASLPELRAGAPGLGPRPWPLLYLMARHGLLTEIERAASGLLVQRKIVAADSLVEAELVGIVEPREQPTLLQRVASVFRAGPSADARAAVERRSTAWARLDMVVPDVSAGATIGEHVHANPSVEINGELRPQFPGVADIRTALELLQTAPTAELDRVFTETLDLCSHRLDAWITALHSARLERMRQRRPDGLLIGEYGWVEDLRPDPPTRRKTVTLEDGRTVNALTDSAGYLRAPSILHGATAAVLRSAYLSRSGGSEEPYAIDLSSRRVRTAMWLLDAVRGGQPLGAVLGYRFERGLHEGHPGVELDKFIDAFRARYPLRTPSAEAGSGPSESVPARNVVDGLRLHKAFKKATIPWSAPGFQPNGSERDAMEQELRRLDETLDAVADLLTAESVYQVLRGTPEGVAATLDTLAKGVRPPEPEVARVPRSGTGVYHRMGLVLGGDASLPAQWAAIAATPRSRAEPYLNAWFSHLLGPPSKIVCRVTPPEGPPQTVRLSDLRIQAIDVLMLARQLDNEAADSELDRRVVEAANRIPATDRALEIDYTAAQPNELSFAVALELANSMSDLLGHARPLTPKDLVPPEVEATDADLMASELLGRADTTAAALNMAVSSLETALGPVVSAPEGSVPPLGPLRQALYRAAAFGVASAFPRTHHSMDLDARVDLQARGHSVLDELRQRAATATTTTDPLERLSAILGRGLLVLPRFVPAAPALLTPALDDGPDLGPDPEAAIDAYLRRMARLQPPQDDWRRITAFAEVLGRPIPERRVVQIPHSTPPRRWVALPFSDESERPPGGMLSLMLHRASSPAATEPWVGLLLDEWVERIPHPEEDAGVVFHYDAPAAEAPNALLLALPPQDGPWSLDYLEATLHETLDLARLRAVDHPQLGMLDQFRPLLYLASNPDDVTISTSFVGHLVAHAVIASD